MCIRDRGESVKHLKRASHKFVLEMKKITIVAIDYDTIDKFCIFCIKFNVCLDITHTSMSHKSYNPVVRHYI